MTESDGERSSVPNEHLPSSGEVTGNTLPNSPPNHSNGFHFVPSLNPKMAALWKLVERVANTDATVLLSGESGVGKGIVANFIQSLSHRKERQYVKINCAALSTELLESELFGHEKGAFTGAYYRKLGKFEVADGGTLFLDEVEELNFALQAKLLHVVQDGEFSRVGGTKQIKVNTRLLVATNRSLEEAVANGHFREDLYYRLNVLHLTIPPLRERTEDILPLAQTFLSAYAKEFRVPVPTLTKATKETFLAYPWPGNIRELENVVKRIVLMDGQEAAARQLKESSLANQIGLENQEFTPKGLKEIARKAAREAERKAIQRTLEQTKWNRLEAAKLLQISYKALLYKIDDCGLSKPNQKD